MNVRPRIVRDPIHEDIPLGPIQAAIVDTPIFQRLRYIKQNGLLHFVFPGAVHTRFSHSLGTFHLAGRAFNSLFENVSRSDPAALASKEFQYIRQVFETAALLHDCGHSAFSHSIEHVRIDGKPFFPSVPELASEWGSDNGLSRWLSGRIEAGELELAPYPSHEEFGLLLIGVLFDGHYAEKVTDTSAALLAVDPIDFADDIRSMIARSLTPSEVFKRCAVQVSNYIPGIEAVPEREQPKQLQRALSTLISGTVDVDRLDYLNRDSRFTGTLYGLCDVGVIINALELCVGEAGGPVLSVGLRKRACQAVDDFLWSRYQLFNQVLNHKTNVVLNALLADALKAAVEKPGLGIGRPLALEDFISFTDEYVMSSVIDASLRDKHSSRRAYHQTLVGRELPRYLGRLDITEVDHAERETLTDSRTQQFVERLRQAGVPDPKVRHWSTESTLLKGTGLPFVLERDKIGGADYPPAPASDPDTYQIPHWCESGRLPASSTYLHFFTDR